MVETRVLELSTAEDVEDFCRTLLRIKRLGPASVSFTVALTVRRDVKTRVANGRTLDHDPIVDLLNVVDPEPLPQTVLPSTQPEPTPTPIESVGTPQAIQRSRSYRRGIVGLR